jgi:hypothetical protein
MKTILAGVAVLGLWAAAPQPAAAMPLAAGVSNADAAVVTDVAYYRRHYRHRYWGPRYVTPYPSYYSYGYYPYRRYYAPGPYVRFGPFGFGAW